MEDIKRTKEVVEGKTANMNEFNTTIVPAIINVENGQRNTLSLIMIKDDELVSIINRNQSKTHNNLSNVRHCETKL
jgi:dsDNA-binding SOS-regulon protein